MAAIVPIETVEPAPYELAKPISVVVHPAEGGGYIASYLDANINASGETPHEAVANLKDIMIGLFECLEREPPENLGKGPREQLVTLKFLLRRK